MSQNFNLNYKKFLFSLVMSFILAVIVLVFSYYIGKNEFFLLLNTDLGRASDYFFQYITNLGDGLLWIVWLLIIIKKRKVLLPLIISSFILTTIFTQIFKYFILPNEKRPSSGITDISQMHFVEGVTLHSINSFPSGHTATAFTFVLLIALIVKRLDVLLLSFIVALLVAYSRIYLGQHFPLDIGGGIIVSICSVSLSVFVQRGFERRSLEKTFSKAV